MCRYYLHVKNNRTTIEIALGVMLLLCGCTIYLLFRSRSLNIYQWCCALGFTDIINYYRGNVENWNVPDIIKFNLPDGMYCASYIFVVDAIWHQESGMQKYLIISLVPLFAIGSELLQGLNIVRGTFDMLDLICYALPPLVYVCVIMFYKFNYPLKKQL